MYVVRFDHSSELRIWREASALPSNTYNYVEVYIELELRGLHR